MPKAENVNVSFTRMTFMDLPSSGLYRALVPRLSSTEDSICHSRRTKDGAEEESVGRRLGRIKEQVKRRVGLKGRMSPLEMAKMTTGQKADHRARCGAQCNRGGAERRRSRPRRRGHAARGEDERRGQVGECRGEARRASAAPGPEAARSAGGGAAQVT